MSSDDDCPTPEFEDVILGSSGGRRAPPADGSAHECSDLVQRSQSGGNWSFDSELESALEVPPLRAPVHTNTPTPLHPAVSHIYTRR